MSGTPPVRRVVGLLPVLGVAVASVALPVAASVAVRDVVLFVLGTLWTALVPGVLLLRAFRGRPQTALGEICGGYVVGTIAQIAAVAVAVVLGHGGLVLAYPVVVLAVFAGVPGLRPLLRHRPYAARTPALATWLISAAYLLVLAREAVPYLRGTPLPPRSGYWYPDLPWNLAIAFELTRSVPPQDPQVAGAGLTYHWFAHAQMAAMSLSSGVDVAVVFTKLWVIPTYAAGLGMTYLLGRRLARSPWAGVIAVWCIALPVSTYLGQVLPQFTEHAFNANSPTQIFGVPIMLAGCWLLVDAVRGDLRRADWVALPFVLLACAGAKSSILPTLGAGLAFAGLLILLRRRHWRQPLITLLLLGALTLATMPWLAGGRSASRLDPLLLTRLQPYASAETAGLGTGWLVLIFLLTLLLIVSQKAHLLTVLGARSTRQDPAVWFLIGCVLAGFTASRVIDHSGGSQFYFVMGILPLIGVLAGWGLVAAWRSAEPATRRRAAGAGALAGVVLQGLLWLPTASWARITSLGDALRLLVVVLVPVVAGGTVWWLVRAHLRRGEPAAAARLSLAAVTALLAATALPSLWYGGQAVADKVGAGVPVRHLSRAEVQGATWIKRHTPSTDVIATNVHHWPGSEPRAYREFWVPALTARRTYLGSWGYTDEAFAAHEVNGLRYNEQPFHDPDRFERNEIAFTAPTRAALDELYRHDVRWLYADRAAGPVSPRLPDLATLRYEKNGVQVFQLHRPRH